MKTHTPEEVHDNLKTPCQQLAILRGKYDWSVSELQILAALGELQSAYVDEVAELAGYAVHHCREMLTGFSNCKYVTLSRIRGRIYYTATERCIDIYEAVFGKLIKGDAE